MAWISGIESALFPPLVWCHGEERNDLLARRARDRDVLRSTFFAGDDSNSRYRDVQTRCQEAAKGVVSAAVDGWRRKADFELAVVFAFD